MDRRLPRRIGLKRDTKKFIYIMPRIIESSKTLRNLKFERMKEHTNYS